MRHEEDRAWSLARVLAPPGVAVRALPSARELEVWVEAHGRRLGLSRPVVAHEEAQEDPRWLGWWLLKMAATTYARCLEPWPDVDPGLLRALEAWLEARPPRDEAHGQLHIDAASCLRRARAVHARLAQAPGPVLAVGDDDGVTIALALLGTRSLHAVDVDRRILAYLRQVGEHLGSPIEATEVDIFEAPLPGPLRRRCAAAVTDPLRSAEDGLPFLLFGAAALRRDAPSWLFYADHPDWNFEHVEVATALSEAGLACLDVIEDLHAYPITPELFPRLQDTAAELGTAAEWLEALATHSAAWTHLYVYGPRPRP
jgi:hypothetical protein